MKLREKYGFDYNGNGSVHSKPGGVVGHWGSDPDELGGRSGLLRATGSNSGSSDDRMIFFAYKSVLDK